MIAIIIVNFFHNSELHILKFDWEETELGRIVLSASEPYCLLITPQLWTYNNGYLLNPPESFISSSSVEQKKQIHDILFEGVDDTETVLAGGIIDYTHKEEIFGFMVSYFSTLIECTRYSGDHAKISKAHNKLEI